MTGPAPPPALLLVLFFVWPSLGSPLYVVVAPNILRVGSEESVYLEAHGTTGPVKVTLTVMGFPGDQFALYSHEVTLDRSTLFQALHKIKIDELHLQSKPNSNQYVSLKAKFKDSANKDSVHNVETVVLVSFQSVFIHLQTDKPIYNPGERVRYRVFLTNTAGRSATDVVTVQIKNPQGSIVERDGGRTTHKGIFSNSYILPEGAKLGSWTLEAKLQNHEDILASSEFEVKKHVLPTFEVILKPSKKYFHVDDGEFSVDIQARYLFGVDVEGSAYVVFGHIDSEGRRTSFPASLQRVVLQSGTAKATLLRDQIHAVNIYNIVGHSIYARATVFTITGSDIVSAELTDIKVAKSPYRIEFTKSPRYFKPGLPFGLYVYLSHTDGSPAGGITLRVEDMTAITDRHGTAILPVNTAKHEHLKIMTVRTRDSSLPATHQAEAKITLSAYETESVKEYLHLSAPGGTVVSLNSLLQISVTFHSEGAQQNLPTDSVSFMVVSRSQIIQKGKWPVTAGQKVMKQSLKVTPEMLPSFRLVAYYSVPQRGQQIMSDSLWVDVEDVCMGTLQLSIPKKKSEYHPANFIRLHVKGDPGAIVGLVAVDKAVYAVSNKGRLTQSKIWDAVEDKDMGCTRGGGRNNMGIFTDAGLLFLSSSGTKTPPRQTHLCPSDSPHRGRRALVQSDSETSFMEDIFVRHVFSSSFLWVMQELRGTPKDDGLATFEQIYAVKDSTTQWQILAVSSSPTTGVCVAEPVEVTVKKRLFVDLLLPYSVVNKEQVEIKVVVHNFYSASPDSLSVTVDLLESEGICSLASEKGKYRQEVAVDAQSSRVVLFTIVPLQVGSHDITVKAFSMEEELGDGVRKTLLVVPQGVQKTRTMLRTLDPSITGGNQEETFFPPPLPLQVPGTEAKTFITVFGDVLTDRVQNSLSGSVLSGLLRMPGGSVEQNLASMTSPLIAIHYLDSANAWESVGVQRRQEALAYIRAGYVNQLQYRKNDDSYPPYNNEKSSTWVTAYTAKVFALVFLYMEVQEDHVCLPLKYLAQSRQSPDGHFREDAAVSDQSMTGGVKDGEHTALTAFVLIAMAEAKDICQSRVPGLASSMQRASQYLSGRLSSLSSPYSVAISSYALALLDQTSSTLLSQLKRVSASDGSHWGGYDAVGVEATGYALLTLLKLGQLDQAAPVSRWLMEQVDLSGNYGSIQCTMVVIQALAKYQLQQRSLEDRGLEVKLLFGKWKAVWLFSTASNPVSRTEKFTGSRNFTAVARGRGTGKIAVETVYYAIPSPQEKGACQGYDLDLDIKETPLIMLREKHGERVPEGVNQAYTLTICLRPLRGTPDTMTNLDVSLPTGFVPSLSNLEERLRADGLVDAYNVDRELSKRGSLIIHLKRLPEGSKHCIPVVLYREFKVGLLQPSAVRAYAYNNAEKSCTKFYHPAGNSTELAVSCKEEVCRCVEVGCPSLKQKTLDRMEEVCRGSNYVYKMTVAEVHTSALVDKYIMEIKYVVNQGQDPVVQGEKREFVSHSSCRNSLGLKQGQNLLIIGQPRDLLQAADGGFSYFLSSGTWLERIPSEAECQGAQQKTCTDIEDFVFNLQVFGCPI
ncbi:complement C3-like isoform X2 [Megalops cyprinoides]|uniref:complement C3-like isoform X2 n=1 Tax=Megalops cyprinoides TaxID=118141 RepID=UPI0018644E44|nr:complement C3-like isoform X2 [Megalops cyprinoides]